MNEKIIEMLFKSYVAEKEDREYHSEAAMKELDEFLALLADRINDAGAETEISVKALGLANEYELDGFIAGFMAAMQMFGIGAASGREVA